ncbi:hypothetical protein NUM3379_17570 [Kineococcus sp. NUM-3379]
MTGTGTGGDTSGDTGGDTVVVRRIHTVGHGDDLHALVLDHVRFEGGGVVVPDDWAERTDAHLRAGRLRIFVAEQHGRAVGYASLTDELSTWTAGGYAHLDCLYLHEDHRGRGTGNRLLTAALGDARRRGLVQAQWQTPAWNRSAIAFYERLGATHTAKERFTLTLPLHSSRALASGPCPDLRCCTPTTPGGPCVPPACSRPSSGRWNPWASPGRPTTSARPPCPA